MKLKKRSVDKWLIMWSRKRRRSKEGGLSRSSVRRRKARSVRRDPKVLKSTLIVLKYM